MLNIVKEININRNSDYDCILIHGYTGSPKSFNGLPEFISNALNMNVKVPVLPGHGTNVRDLDNISYNDLYNAVEKEVIESLRNNRKLVLLGYSYGCIIAVDLARKFKIHGIILIAPVYSIRFPFNLKPIKLLKYVKPTWKKKLRRKEYSMKDSFFYDYMHVNVLEIYHETKKRFRRFLKETNCPVLVIYSDKDRVVPSNSVKKLYKSIKMPNKSYSKYHTNFHNLFYSNNLVEIEMDIASFVHSIKKDNDYGSVSAVICAYNEEKNILTVLNALKDTRYIDEIVIVNDGSNDRTDEVVRRFIENHDGYGMNIKYIRNHKNLGKGVSMDIGASNAKNDFVFFCDADLKNVKAEHFDSIIYPVISGNVAMSLGIRNNVLQKTWSFVAVLTGERCLRKDLWNRLPMYYKNKFRIETGLNYYCKKYYNNYLAISYPYYQTLKEQKYGLVKGFARRMVMYKDVVVAWISCRIYDMSIIQGLL